MVAETPDGIDWVKSMDKLDDLLSESDFVVVAAPHTPETDGMFDAGLFQRMKQGSYFINIGRGAIVQLDPLVDALKSGHLNGAALDVFETEPLPPEHALWSMEQVLITPHIASASPRIAERHLESLVENLRRFAAGEPLLNVVNKRLWF